MSSCLIFHVLRGLNVFGSLILVPVLSQTAKSSIH